ncbi:hypothetical protein HG530_008192 [Fusarium avenaceum]|nr:hypothetical protein HG530_008192 [Fusarium avenaceum]
MGFLGTLEKVQRAVHICVEVMSWELQRREYTRTGGQILGVSDVDLINAEMRVKEMGSDIGALDLWGVELVEVVNYHDLPVSLGQKGFNKCLVRFAWLQTGFEKLTQSLVVPWSVPPRAAAPLEAVVVNGLITENDKVAVKKTSRLVDNRGCGLGRQNLAKINPDMVFEIPLHKVSQLASGHGLLSHPLTPDFLFSNDLANHALLAYQWKTQAETSFHPFHGAAK